MTRREQSHALVRRHLNAAVSEAGANWCDLVRQDVERRLGRTDEVVIDDPEYGAALDAFRAINDALDLVRRVGP